MQKKPNVLYVHAFVALFIKRRRAKSWIQISMRAKSNPFQGRREDLSQRSLSDEEKLFIGSLVGKDKETTRSVGEFYQIGKSTVGRRSRRYKDKAPPKKSGRPSKLDDISTSAICEALGGEKRIQMNDAERKKLLRDEVKNAADRAKTSVAPMSRQNVQRFEDKSKITTDKNPEEGKRRVKT